MLIFIQKKSIIVLNSPENYLYIHLTVTKINVFMNYQTPYLEMGKWRLNEHH